MLFWISHHSVDFNHIFKPSLQLKNAFRHGAMTLVVEGNSAENSGRFGKGGENDCLVTKSFFSLKMSV